MDLGPLRRAFTDDDGQLVLEFWEAMPPDADLMAWFTGTTFQVTAQVVRIERIDPPPPEVPDTLPTEPLDAQEG